MKSKLSIILIFTLIVSCSKKEEIKPVKWNFMDSSFDDVRFGNQNLHMLCMYDGFELRKLNDSTIVLNLEIFKGWDQKWEPFSDTLKLNKSTFKMDSIGNTIEQKMNFKKNEEIDFELIVNQKPGTNDSIKFYDYKGKLSIQTDDVDYFCEELYVK